MLSFPKNQLSGLPPVNVSEKGDTIAEGRINGGMVTSIDKADIETSQFFNLKNARVRYDVTSRRPGTILLTPAKPNSLKVLLISTWERFNNSVEVLRFTKSTNHRRNTASWSSVVGVLNGGDNDRFNIAIANDRFFFANNGADPIQEINIGALTFAQAGNAPRYRYIIGFNNRIVAANLADAISPSAIQLGWSGNLNFAEWDKLVDPSAGNVPLIDSTTDFSDDITGLFSFTNTAIILRERSIWGLDKQPITDFPFNPYPIFTGIGCDSPNSAVSVTGGIAWYDLRTASVWFYEVGSPKPVRIATPVELTIADQVENVENLFATYDTLQDEYTLAIPSNISNTVRLWTYNFKTKTWVYDERFNTSAISSVDFASAALVIDELVGFIDGLVGFIDDLGFSVSRASRFYGRTTGEIDVESELADTDSDTVYTLVGENKIITVPEKVGYVQILYVKYVPKFAGSFALYYSKDGGLTYTLYKTVAFDNTMINKRKIVKCKKHLRCEQYNWKIEATSGIFDLIEFAIIAVPSNAEIPTR